MSMKHIETLRDIRKIVIKQLLNNSIIKMMKTLISNTVLGKEYIFNAIDAP